MRATTSVLIRPRVRDVKRTATIHAAPTVTRLARDTFAVAGAPASGADRSAERDASTDMRPSSITTGAMAGNADHVGCHCTTTRHSGQDRECPHRMSNPRIVPRMCREEFPPILVDA